MGSMPIILAPRTSPGFDGLNEGITKGGYYAALANRYRGRKDGNTNASRQQKLLMDLSSGNPADAVGKDAYLKAAQGQEQLNPGEIDMLDAGQQTTDAQGNPIDQSGYGENVRNALIGDTGYTKQQIQRKALGLPIESPNEKMQAKMSLLAERESYKQDSPQWQLADQKLKNFTGDDSTDPAVAGSDIDSQVTAELTKLGAPLTPGNIAAAKRKLSGR